MNFIGIWPAPGSGLLQTVSEAIGSGNVPAATAAATTGTPSLNNGGMVSYGYILLYLLLLAAIIAVLFFLRRYLLNRMGGFKSTAYMNIIDRISVAQDRQLALMKVGERIILVGITPHHIETLYTFTDAEAENVKAQEKIFQDRRAGFAGMLKKTVKNPKPPGLDNNP